MQPVLVGLSPKAKKLFTTYYNAHAIEQAALAGDLSAAWSKLEEYAARLALVIHLVRLAAGDATLACVYKVDEVRTCLQITYFERAGGSLGQSW